MQSEPTQGRLDGRVAIVVGASRGIGLATAERLVAEGAFVVVTARGRDSLDKACAQLPADRCAAVAGNSSDPDHRAEALDLVAQRWGRLDVLANMVGTNPFFGALLDLPVPTAERVLRTNLLSALGWIQGAVAHPELGFRERGGSVINLSSVVAETPSPGIGFYGVSKAAVNQLTRTLAVELGPTIRVNAVSPGVVRTDFSRALYEDREDEVAASYPLGRLGEPQDVAAAIAFLASDDASWVSGQVLTIDGGLMAAGGRA